MSLWKNILIYIAIGIFGAAAITGICCSVFITPKTHNLSTLTIDCPESVTVELGQNYLLPVVCSDETAVITLTSANEEIVEIENFNLISKSIGTANINVNAKSKTESVNKSVHVIVKKNISNLNINLPAEITLYTLDKHKNEAYAANLYDFVNFDCEYNIGFNLSNENVVSIKNNKITAQNVGETIVTFYALEKPSVTSSHKISVIAISPNFTLSSDETISVKIGKSEYFSYEITPSYYFGSANITTKIIDTEIASVSGRKVTGLQTGTTDLEIYLNDELVKTINIVVTSSQNAVVTPPEDNQNEENNPPSSQNNENSVTTTPEDNQNEENNNPPSSQNNENSVTTPPEDNQNNTPDEESSNLGGNTNPTQPDNNEEIVNNEKPGEETGENTEESSEKTAENENQSLNNENNDENIEENPPANTGNENNEPEELEENNNEEPEPLENNEEAEYSVVIISDAYNAENKTLSMAAPVIQIQFEVRDKDGQIVSDFGEIEITKTNGLNVILNPPARLLVDARFIIDAEEETSFTIAIDSLNLSEKIIVLI